MTQYTRATFDEVVIQNYAPADFIPVLEETMLIYKLDLYVVEQALAKMKKPVKIILILLAGLQSMRSGIVLMNWSRC